MEGCKLHACLQNHCHVLYAINCALQIQIFIVHVNLLIISRCLRQFCHYNKMQLTKAINPKCGISNMLIWLLSTPDTRNQVIETHLLLLRNNQTVMAFICSG